MKFYIFKLISILIILIIGVPIVFNHVHPWIGIITFIVFVAFFIHYLIKFIKLF